MRNRSTPTPLADRICNMLAKVHEPMTDLDIAQHLWPLWKCRTDSRAASRVFGILDRLRLDGLVKREGEGWSIVREASHASH
jgi:hypothetical protein